MQAPNPHVDIFSQIPQVVACEILYHVTRYADLMSAAWCGSHALRAAVIYLCRNTVWRENHMMRGVTCMVKLRAFPVLIFNADSWGASLIRVMARYASTQSKHFHNGLYELGLYSASQFARARGWAPNCLVEPPAGANVVNFYFSAPPLHKRGCAAARAGLKNTDAAASALLQASDCECSRRFTHKEAFAAVSDDAISNLMLTCAASPRSDIASAVMDTLLTEAESREKLCVTFYMLHILTSRGRTEWLARVWALISRTPDRARSELDIARRHCKTAPVLAELNRLAAAASLPATDAKSLTVAAIKYVKKPVLASIAKAKPPAPPQAQELYIEGLCARANRDWADATFDMITDKIGDDLALRELLSHCARVGALDCFKLLLEKLKARAAAKDKKDFWDAETADILLSDTVYTGIFYVLQRELRDLPQLGCREIPMDLNSAELPCILRICNMYYSDGSRMVRPAPQSICDLVLHSRFDLLSLMLSENALPNGPKDYCAAADAENNPAEWRGAWRIAFVLAHRLASLSCGEQSPEVLELRRLLALMMD